MLSEKIREKLEYSGKNESFNKAIAEQAALAGLLPPIVAGKGMFTAGIGGQMQNFAVAVGAGYKFKNNLSIRGALSTSFKSISYNAAFGIEF